jgi:BolA family transcriptional regulator, general stress-responsive regulator
MSIERRIRDRLTEALQPLRLDVINESHLHAGHAGDDGSGETHFSVRVVAAAFAGQSRIARHRLVNDALTAEFRDGVHALSVKALTPDEAADR